MIKDVTGTKSSFQSPIHRTEHPQTDNDKQKDSVMVQSQVEQHQEDPTEMKKTLEKVVNGLNEFLDPTGTHLKFEFHEKLKEYYVTIINSEDNEVVKEIPPKKLLDMYAAMREYLGLMVDRKI